MYGSKFNIYDEISIELNMDQRTLGFYVNNVYQGKAVDGIDASKSYCLAISLHSPNYDIQIV